MAKREGNLVETLRQLIDAEVNGHLEVELPELVAAIQTHFQTRPRLRQLLVTEALPALVVRITHQVMHERRVITEVAVDPRERAAAIFESVGSGQYRSLLALKRPDCVYIDERRHSCSERRSSARHDRTRPARVPTLRASPHRRA